MTAVAALNPAPQNNGIARKTPAKGRIVRINTARR